VDKSAMCARLTVHAENCGDEYPKLLSGGYEGELNRVI
jgi:hypothetical protein